MGLEFEQKLIEDEIMFDPLLSKKVTGKYIILEIKNLISTVNFVSYNTFSHWELNEIRGLIYSRIDYWFKLFNEI